MLGVGLTDVYCSATLAGCPLPRKGFFAIRLLRITMSSSLLFFVLVPGLVSFVPASVRLSGRQR